MARFQRFRNAYNRQYFSRYSLTRGRAWRSKSGRFGATLNPMFFVGGAAGYTGFVDGFVPPIARQALMLYGAIPFSIKGLGFVKHIARGYTAGVVLRSMTGGLNIGLPGSGSDVV